MNSDTIAAARCPLCPFEAAADAAETPWSAWQFVSRAIWTHRNTAHVGAPA